MAFDEQLDRRISRIVRRRKGVTTKKMFGGVAFLSWGNMFCGVVGEDFMVRVGPDGYEEALSEPHVREMDFTGRPMKGMIYVSPRGTRSDDDLQTWIEKGLAFARSLPRKDSDK